MSAVSRKSMPASRAASITARVASSPMRPPKLLQPRPAALTSSRPSLGIEPVVDQAARDGDRRRHVQAVDRTGADPLELGAREPAHVLELVVVHRWLAAR